MELTQQEARAIVYDEADGWERVTEDAIYNTNRWSKMFKAVFRHTETGKCYELRWQSGATEMQDESPFETTKPNPVEVEEREVTRKEWFPVGQ